MAYRRPQGRFLDQMQNFLPPGWPQAYRSFSGTVLQSNLSNSFPLVAWTRTAGFEIAFLIPDSLLFGESLHLLTQSKRSNYGGLGVGQALDRVTVLNDVAGTGTDNRDYTVKSFIVDQRRFGRDSAHHEGLLNCLYYDCIFSEASARGVQKCRASGLGQIPFSPLYKGGLLVPNIVYQCVVHCRLVIANNGGVPSGARTRIEVHPELVRVERVKLIRKHPLQGPQDLADQRLMISACPWNSASPVPPRPAFPPPQRRFLRDIPVYFLDGQLIRVNSPKTVIKYLPGTAEMQVDSRPPLENGRCTMADLIQNDFVGYGCYYVQQIWVMNEWKGWMPEWDWDTEKKWIPGQRKLPKRTVLENGQVHEEYCIRVAESTQFKDFYTSEPLRHCLIADPQRMLRNVDFEEHERSWGVPVWIRLNRTPEEPQWLALFTITALDKESGEYSTEEKMMDQPMITGIGILADPATGAVFSPDHPQKAIRMSVRDMARTAFGHFFHFSAAFWPQREHYVIGGIHPIAEDILEPVETFKGDGGQILFADSFNCYLPQIFDVHLSERFGPLDDRKEQFVTGRTRREGQDWPSKASGFVKLNPDWVPGRFAHMKLGGLEVPEEYVNVTSIIPEREQYAPANVASIVSKQYNTSTEEQEQLEGGGGHASRFSELFHVLHEVAANCTAESMDGKLFERVEELDRECAEFMMLELENEK